ncbi:MAG TPA: TetR/AcrR family transcriptional regulator [Solirubrobacteraceae bacterium]|nr:TetR/AcrR family transcriptional regulator [Solirubrobacteraceae bacterium]
MPSKRTQVAPGPGDRVARAQNGSQSAHNGRLRVADLQRSRLLDGAVAATEELGWPNVSVASITSRARVSRRTFYDLFRDREDCLLAVLRATQERIAAELHAACLDGLGWRERVRGGLWVILCFFDREPELARLCVVQSALGGPQVSAWRLDVLARLAAIVDQGRSESERTGEVTQLAAEGSVGAVLAILNLRLSSGGEVSLRGLLGALMGLIVLPYLGSGEALRERKRAKPAPPVVSLLPEPTRAYRPGNNPLTTVPMRLTYRTVRVLEAIAQQSGASNRQIGELADIHDQGQVSKLLARLQGLGLLANAAGHDTRTKGAPNAWSLTELGDRVIEHLSLDSESHRDAA